MRSATRPRSRRRLGNFARHFYGPVHVRLPLAWSSGRSAVNNARRRHRATSGTFASRTESADSGKQKKKREGGGCGCEEREDEEASSSVLVSFFLLFLCRVTQATRGDAAGKILFSFNPIGRQIGPFLFSLRRVRPPSPPSSSVSVRRLFLLFVVLLSLPRSLSFDDGAYPDE